MIELGPLGIRINWGQRKHIEDIPEGYRAVSLDARTECIIVYIEPIEQ